MDTSAKIFVAGHRGLVGSAIVRRLERAGCDNLLLADRARLDLTRQDAVAAFFDAEKPAYVFDAAARVGGIHANATYAADFIRDNLLIQNNLIDSAYRSGVEKFVFLGSSCIYPREALQPMPETSLLTGPLEATNEWYAVAKIAGIKMCQAYRQQHGFNAISLMPTNLYGPGDNFHPDNSHVLPALLNKFHAAVKTGAASVEVWGSGRPRREFLHVDDLADAALYLMRHYDEPAIVNVGVGEDISIAELAALIARTVGFEGDLVFDPSKPDGTPRKLLDVSRLSELGWRASIGLEQGVAQTYEWYLDNVDRLRKV
ncbi:MAG: GDP-L-fucose synthase [Pseudomonadota bacterium]